MALTVLTGTAAIAHRVEEALNADPIRNTVYSSVLAALRRPDGDGWCACDGAAVAARSRPDTPIALTAGWSDLRPLAAALAGLPSIASIGGPVDCVDTLVAALGREPSSRTSLRLFRCDDLRPPPSVAGRPRPATDDDDALLIAWFGAFGLEALGRSDTEAAIRSAVDVALDSRHPWIWTAADGTPVSMAIRHPALVGVARIGPVYTPPAHRGHGYGSAVTAAATRSILDDAAVAVLYTDLANPTSNKIYQLLGYVPVVDRVEVTFSR